MAIRSASVLALVAIAACGAVPKPHLGAGADLAIVRSMERALERGPQRIEELTNAGLEIRGVRTVYESEPGGSARVVLVDTSRGTLIGKISYVRTVSSRMVPWILQDEVSRAGFAPALHKIVEGQALATLFRNDRLLRRLKSPWRENPDSPPVSMVVMDVATDGFSFMQWERSGRSLAAYRPSALPAWTHRLKEIEAYLNRANLQMVDEQFLIQPNGDVVVVDFDHYTFVDSRNRRWAYAGVTGYPDLDYWRMPSPTRKLNDVTPNLRILRSLPLGDPRPDLGRHCGPTRPSDRRADAGR